METEIEAQNYTIKTAVFEGPFGLLLHLVEKRKLFINDLSLAQVTEDYLNYINKLNGDGTSAEKISTAEISSFIVVAATLILIKSKSLLPDLSLTDEEQGDIRKLEERLRLYELFTKLSQNIKKSFGKKIIFPAQERKNDVLVFLPDDQITRESMMTFAREALGKMPKKEFLPEVEVKKVISIEEMIDKLTTRIQNSIKMTFKDFAGKTVTREEKVFVIISFLAVLELVRQGILSAVQENHSADIIIEHSNQPK